MTLNTTTQGSPATPSASAKPLIKTILFATDGTSGADEAFANALRLARHNNARLIITYFASPDDIALFDGAPCENVEQWQDTGKKILAELAQRATEAGVPEVETILEKSQNQERLNELAQRLNVNLIILASHLF